MCRVIMNKDINETEIGNLVMRFRNFDRYFFKPCLLFVCLSWPVGIQASPPAVKMSPLFLIQGSQGKSFQQPTDVAVGKDGTIYVMDGLNSRVAVFDAQGKDLFSFGSRGSEEGEFLRPVGITTSPDGNVIVADTGNHRLQVFSPGGRFLWAFALVSGSSGDPTDVCVSEQGDVFYVCDNDNHQVHAYSSRGKLLRILGKRGDALGEFRYPATLKLDKEDRLYVVDALNARVQVFDLQGRVMRQISEWGSLQGKLLRPKGVAVDKEQIFISDSHTGRILVFSLEGVFQGFVADEKGEAIRFITPTNIVFDDSGRLYVVETRDNRIRILNSRQS